MTLGAAPADSTPAGSVPAGSVRADAGLAGSAGSVPADAGLAGSVSAGVHPAATAPAEPSPPRSSGPRAWAERGGLAVVTLGCLAFYLVHAIGEQDRFLTTGYDLGIFDQAVRAYAHFRAPVVPLKGAHYNVFGDHFHPIIATLAPFYWIWNSPNVLLGGQAVLTAASVVAVHRFTRRRAGAAVSLIVAAAYGFGWPVQALIDFDFHEVAFAAPILAMAIDALDRRRDRHLLVWCLLLVLVREDMGLLVVLLGLGRLTQRRRPRWPSAVMVAGGAAMYVLTTTVIIPHFAAGGLYAYGSQFSALGDSLPAALLHLLTHPWQAVTLMISPQPKLETLAYLFLPSALLCLRSPYVLLTLPLLAERFYNSRANLWQPHFHYNALPWLVIMLAMADGAGRLGLFRPGVRRRGATLVLVAWLVAWPIVLNQNNWAIKPWPVTKIRDADPLGATPASRASAAAVARIPADVCVQATNTLVSHLTPRDWVQLPQTTPAGADFVVLDTSAKDVGNDGPLPAYVYLADIAAGYRVTWFQDSIEILQSPTYRGPSPDCAPLGPGRS